ncbi:unnamed protein product [Adineta steineri]|uniref:G-protein coupled receptors family 1 profile domain-containing protein n=1 Tax=Adineta steineri TaxID=433720 RepID=A0A818QP06_9BILA|nr:unnamed protein product [Adineta steineri]CAF1303853.1 unnamed protein product [Adineta steineri]CAF1376347.1 unnamed protein product [Adineta steineri]CAF3519871.1 unnamed protein product [Adineta steineri]CAF3643586.1 unnamed protein product [Adineta steineri]
MNCSEREEIAHQIELYTYPILLVIGTIGNLLSLIVLIQMRQHSVYRYLTFMSIADTIVLYIGLLRELLLSSNLHIHIQGTLLCKLHVFFFYNTLHLSSWFRCCLNLDRYVAVKFPIFTSKWCRTRQATINSSVVLTILSISNIHLLIFVQGEDKNIINSNRSTVNPFQYQQCYLHESYIYFFERIYTWIDMFLVTIIPFIFIILCNLTVINRVFLVSNSSKKTDLVCRSKATNRLRSLCLMMICSSFVFVATTLPVTAFIIDLLSNKVSFDSIRCRRIQWTIYNILMYFNYASILSYCISGTEFRHVLMKTIHMKTKSSLVSILHTDMMNAVNHRRTSTPQPSHRMYNNYEEKQRYRSLSVSILPATKNNKDQSLVKLNYSNTKYLDIPQPNYHKLYRHSCTSQTNCGGLTPSSITQNARDTGWRSSCLLDTHINDQI